MTMPFVSIYMPTRGRPQMVERAVASVLSQDHSHLEVRVVVDGPDPVTEDVLQKFRGDPRLFVQVLPQSKGSCGARNSAIFEAKGEYITGIDDDDEFLPHHVSDLRGRSRSADFCSKTS
jgi:glycosyltransferase involved in cell wall biosynthesis